MDIYIDSFFIMSTSISIGIEYSDKNWLSSIDILSIK